jgi:hypothetical protein
MDRLATPRNDRVAVHEVHSRLTQEQLEEETVGEELVGALLELGRLVVRASSCSLDPDRRRGRVTNTEARPCVVWSGGAGGTCARHTACV